jgi:DNA-3-methyladenine glycosylase I
MKKCGWVPLDDPLYIKYHDEEWGVPVHDDSKLFEMLMLESAQAGLSWRTVLKKRENYRRAFNGFDFKKIASYDKKKVDELLSDKGIIRNGLKILSAIRNAKAFIKIQKEYGSFDKYIWSYTDFKTVKNSFKTIREIPAKTDLSDSISKDLKKRGMNFVGSTIIYAYLQSIGIVNDHETSCYRYGKV